MSTRPKGGLGRGLSSLIPPAQTREPAADVDVPRETSGTTVEPQADGPVHYAELPIDAIVPNPRQPREVFEEEALAELAFSIGEIGLLQPIVVRPAGEPGRYELVAGERRWRAIQRLGLPTVPAIIRDTADDVLLRDALLENLHRAALNPLEEAAAYGQLLNDFGCTQEQLAERIGRSRPQVTNTLRLLRLPTSVQRRVAAGVISAGHARALLALDSPEQMDALATRVVAEGLSVRSVEEIVAVGEGSAPNPARRQPRKRKASSSEVVEIADRLMERLDTRVKVDVGAARGKVVIEFASLEDLQRIVELIDPNSAQ